MHGVIYSMCMTVYFAFFDNINTASYATCLTAYNNTFIYICTVPIG